MIKVMIFGCPRSGTTFAQSYFLSSNIYSPRETHFFMRVSPPGVLFRFGRFFNSKKRLAGVVDLILKENSMSGSELGYDAFSFENRVNCFDELITKMALRAGKIGWVEKSPEHYRFSDELSKKINDIRFIHVLRNPVSTIASLRDAARRYGGIWAAYENIAYGIRQYNRSISVGLKNHEKDNYLLMDYADMVQHPEITRRRLCEHTGVSLTDCSLEKGSESEMIVRPDEKWKREGRKRDKVQENLNSEEISIIEKRCPLWAVFRKSENCIH